MPEEGKQFTDTLRVRGAFQLHEFPAQSKEETYRQFRAMSADEKFEHTLVNDDNLVVNGGLNSICNLILGINTSSWTHVSVGTSGAASSPSQTDFNATDITPRLAVSSRYLETVGKAHFDQSFGTNDSNGTWQEAGLFLSSSGAATDMMCRKTFTSFVKSTSNTAVIAWTLIFTATGT